MMIIGGSLNKNISHKAILYQKIRSCLIFLALKKNENESEKHIFVPNRKW